MCWEMGRNRQVIILTSISMGGVDILLKPSKTGTPAVDRRCHFIENEKSEVKYTTDVSRICHSSPRVITLSQGRAPVAVQVQGSSAGRIFSGLEKV
ncbi:uncharacterized protein LOC144282257 isoform X2 [Canis aureus]